MNARKILAGAILASSGFWAMGASAATIQFWDWTTDGGFVHGSATCSNGAGNCSLAFDNGSGVTPSGIGGTSSIMTWGTGSTTGDGNGEQSGLQAVNGASGTGGYDAQALGSGPVPIPAFQQLETNAGWFNIGAAVHYNNVITEAGGHMDTSELALQFSLTGPPGPALSDVVDITLNETLNREPCNPPNPQGTVCDDIFTITSLTSPVTFFTGGQLYKLSFQLVGGEGAQVSADGDTIYTAELAPGTATIYNQAQLSTIPAPGALALMGVGLLALGWRVRKAV